MKIEKCYRCLYLKKCKDGSDIVSPNVLFDSRNACRGYSSGDILAEEIEKLNKCNAFELAPEKGLSFTNKILAIFCLKETPVNNLIQAQNEVKK